MAIKYFWILLGNLPNAELNHPSPEHQGEYLQDHEEDIHDWQMLSAYVGFNGNFWVHPWQSIWFIWDALKLTLIRAKANDDSCTWNSK